MAETTPNGQRFVVSPKTIWAITSASAVLEGEDLGPLGPAPRQGRLGDSYIPQRGLLATGGALVEPFDADRHIAADVRVSA